MGKVVHLHGHKIVAECEYCGKNLYEGETFYQAPNLQFENYCSENCIKLELIREISSPESNIRSFTNAFQVQAHKKQQNLKKTKKSRKISK